jgi:predicted dehydrogenase
LANKLGIGFIGSGFVAKFHLQAWRGVRDADVLGIYSPNAEHAQATAALARDLCVGNAQAFNSIEEMIAAPEIDCIWLCGPIIFVTRTCKPFATRFSPGKVSSSA